MNQRGLSQKPSCGGFLDKQEGESRNFGVTDVIQRAETFYPHVNTAPHILLAMPYATANIERTFSTLRRVKKWLRSTMSEERLNGLYMLRVHRKLVKSLGDSFTELVLSRFAENPRKLLFK